MIISVAKIKGPVHRDVVIDRIRGCYDIGSVRGSTRVKVEEAITKSISEGLKTQGSFIWYEDEQLDRKPRSPAGKNMEQVAPRELKETIINVVTRISGAPQKDLINEVARKLGFDRTGGKIVDILITAIAELIGDSKLMESFNMIRANSVRES